MPTTLPLVDPSTGETPAGSPAVRLSRRPVMAVSAVVLVVLGVWFWALYHFTVNGERHSYGADAGAPRTVRVSAGSTYHLAVHGGVRTLTRLGLAPELLGCTYTPSGRSQPRALHITPESQQTKALDQIASFVAPQYGRISVACAGVPAVFVDNADDSGSDRSGLFLLLASIALAMGIPLLLSVLRRHMRETGPLGGQVPDYADDPPASASSQSDNGLGPPR